VGEPVETSGLTMKQVDEVTKLLEEQIAALYYEHSWRKKPAAPSATPGKNETWDLEAVTISRNLHETEEARRP
jgi:1-acyl-sn-glycerol-3-phosphate acyltransferase